MIFCKALIFLAIIIFSVSFLFILSNGLPFDVYLKTICLTMHDVFNTDVASPNVSNFSTYSSKIHIVIHDFPWLAISTYSIRERTI